MNVWQWKMIVCFENTILWNKCKWVINLSMIFYWFICVGRKPIQYSFLSSDDYLCSDARYVNQRVVNKTFVLFDVWLNFTSIKTSYSNIMFTIRKGSSRQYVILLFFDVTDIITMWILKVHYIFIKSMVR